MNEGSIVSEVMRSLAASAALSAAAWGAAGGLTSALLIAGQSRRAIMRQILVGALFSGGVGTAAGALISSWLKLPPEVIPAFGASGSASYLLGIFGPAVAEVLLSRIRKNQLPSEGDK